MSGRVDVRNVAADRKLTRAVHLVAPRIACAVQKRGQLGAGHVCRRGAGCGCSRRNSARGVVYWVRPSSGTQTACSRPPTRSPSTAQTAVFVLAARALDGAQHIVAGREHCRRHAQRVQVARQTGSPRPRRASRCRAACRGPSPARHRPSPGPTPVCQIRRKPPDPQSACASLAYSSVLVKSALNIKEPIV